MECEFDRALCQIDGFVIFQVALYMAFLKNILSLKEPRNCTWVTRSSLGSVAFIRGENWNNEQICFSSVNTGLSE